MRKHRVRYVGRHRQKSGYREFLCVIGLFLLQCALVGACSGLVRVAAGQPPSIEEVLAWRDLLLTLSGGPQESH